jgi:hypothetical protein
VCGLCVRFVHTLLVLCLSVGDAAACISCGIRGRSLRSHGCLHTFWCWWPLLAPSSCLHMSWCWLVGCSPCATRPAQVVVCAPHSIPCFCPPAGLLSSTRRVSLCAGWPQHATPSMVLVVVPPASETVRVCQGSRLGRQGLRRASWGCWKVWLGPVALLSNVKA